MNIIKLITSHGTESFSGKGGHYYSLVKIANELSKEHTINVFSFGESPSPVISDKNNELDTTHIFIRNVRDLFKFHKNRNLYDSVNNSDVIHCYDTESLIYGGKLSRRFNIPIVLTKCGGEDPKSFFPFVNDLILFSKENENYFKSKRKFKQTRTYVIPNRVDSFESDPTRINELQKEINSGRELKILIIARFVKKYLHAHMQVLNLAAKLREEGIPCKSILIGHALDYEVVEKVKNKSTELDYIITDKKYCHDARKLIPISDIVVGHGRSIMEAAQFGKLLMVPSEYEKLPLLVNKENLNDFMSHNMTGRGILEKLDIYKLLNFISYKYKSEQFSKYLHEEYFSLDRVQDKYVSIYKNINNNMSLIDLQLLQLNKIIKLIR